LIPRAEFSITWVLIIVVALAIIGLGWMTFFSGVFQGAEEVSENPAVEEATEEAKQFLGNATSD